jgi:GT2 family glycosyltransferase
MTLTLKKFADIFNEKPKIGLIQPRVDAAEETKDLPTPKRWIPRLIKGDAKTPSPATTLWEGAIAIRRITFKQTGGWPDNFFYAHEGIELCWQVWNANQIPWYAGDIGIKHPVINPARHAFFYKLNARNRVWLARRNLPIGFAQLYVLTWTLLSLKRFRKPEQRTPWLEGLKEGYSQDCGKNKRLTLQAIWNMTRAGRPPII